MQDDKIYIIKENPTFYKLNGAIYNRDETGYLQALNRIKKTAKEKEMLDKLAEIDIMNTRMTELEQTVVDKLDSIEKLLFTLLSEVK